MGTCRDAAPDHLDFITAKLYKEEQVINRMFDLIFANTTERNLFDSQVIFPDIFLSMAVFTQQTMSRRGHRLFLEVYLEIICL